MEKWNKKERRVALFNQDFYDKMLEVHTDIKYIKTWIEEHKVEDDTRHDGMDARIKSIEDDRFKIVGGATVLGIIGGFLTKLFFK